MYTPWLKAPAALPTDLPSYAFATGLRQRARKMTVAIVGLDAAVAKKTRHYLYRTAWDFGDLRVRDLGDVRKPNVDFVIPLLRELHGAGIIPLLLGGAPAHFRSQYLAFAELRRQVSLLQLDSRIELSPTPPAAGDERLLDAALYRPQRRQFHLTHVGSQQHLIDPAIPRAFSLADYEHVSLGTAKGDLTRLEPVLRDADLVGIDIRALHHQDAPARREIQPSGFNLQEACQLAYYAGHSDKLSSFGLYGLNTSSPEAEQELTAAGYAQLAWYFLQGIHQRAGDFPARSDNMTEYIVDIEGLHQLTFWRSNTTTRWWVQIPDGSYKGEERHRLVPCSYEDFLEASQEQTLPDRLLMAFRRYA